MSAITFGAKRSSNSSGVLTEAEILTAANINEVKTAVNDNYSIINTMRGKEYYPSASEADHGVAGNGNSIKTMVEAIGVSTNATIILKHTGSSSTTTYTLTTSEEIPSNINFIIERGAVINGAGTLTISGEFKGSTGCFGSSITVLFGVGSNEKVRPEYWGTGTGAVLKAVDAVEETGIPVILTGGVNYPFATTLSITTDNMVIKGTNTSSNDWDDSISATLEYTGTSGTAVQLGKAPGASITMMRNTRLENLTIKVTENTDVAIDMWQCTNATLRKVHIGGNSDKDLSYNYGLRIRGGVNNLFEMVSIRGNGDGTATSDNWLRYGVYIENGYSNDPATTTTFLKTYISLCWRGLSHGPNVHASYYDSIFESCTTKAMEIYGIARFFGCWWEDVPEVAYVSFGTSTSKALFISGSQSINIGTNQNFITSAAATERIVLIGNKFSSSHASPVIIQTSGTAPIVTSISNTFPTNSVLIESAYAHLATVFSVEEGILSTASVDLVKAYISTGNVSARHLKGFRINNYGQTTDTVLTLPAAEAGMNAIFEIVDTSNYLHFAPPSGTAFMFVDSTGAIAVMAANEKIVIAQLDMAIGEELKITTYQTGASTYAYKVVQTIGDGAAQETP